jgi:hypothetical protein
MELKFRSLAHKKILLNPIKVQLIFIFIYFVINLFLKKSKWSPFGYIMENFEKIKKSRQFDDGEQICDKEKQRGKKKLNKKKKREERLEKLAEE